MVRVGKKKRKGINGKAKSSHPPYFLGPDVSASVYKHLTEEEIEKLTLEISGVKKSRFTGKRRSCRRIS